MKITLANVRDLLAIIIMSAIIIIGSIVGINLGVAYHRAHQVEKQVDEFTRQQQIDGTGVSCKANQSPDWPVGCNPALPRF